jgi:hypothetical protein
MVTRWKSLELAPSLVEKAKKLWDKVAIRRAPAASAPSTQDDAPTEIRILALERRVARLEEEAASSFEVVGSIAQQHSQLAEQHSEVVEMADALLVRTRSLVWACGALGAAVLVLLIVVLSR